jgi:hypothetical protein
MNELVDFASLNLSPPMRRYICRLAANMRSRAAWLQERWTDATLCSPSSDQA